MSGRQWRQTAMHVKLEAWILLILGDAKQNVARTQWRIQCELVYPLVVARGCCEFLEKKNLAYSSTVCPCHWIIVVVLTELDFVEKLHFGDMASQMTVSGNASQSAQNQGLNPKLQQVPQCGQCVDTLQVNRKKDECILGAAPSRRGHARFVRFITPNDFVCLHNLLNLCPKSAPELSEKAPSGMNPDKMPTSSLSTQGVPRLQLSASCGNG